MKRILERLIQRLDQPAGIVGATFIGAFLETTVLPIPFEVLMVPLMLRHQRMVWLIVCAALAGCMAGALAGYAVGLFAFQSFGQSLLVWLGAEQAMDAFTGRLEKNGFWAIFLVGFTPVPVQVATLGAGFTEVNPGVFTLAMLLSRALRYGGLGLLVFWLGEEVHHLLKRHRRTALVLGLLLTAVLAFLLFGPEGN